MSNFDEVLSERFEVSYEAVRSELELSLRDFLELQKAYKDSIDFDVDEAKVFLAEVEVTIENIQSGIEKIKDPKLRKWFLTEGIKIAKTVITEEDYQILVKGMDISQRLEDTIQGHFEELARFLIHNQENKILH